MNLTTSRAIRNFPIDAILMGLVGLCILSWTNSIHLFRLNVAPVYEHMIAYALFGFVIVAAKAEFRFTILEIALVILLAASLEAIKAAVPYRHPKTVDFFADMMGLFISIGVTVIVRIFWNTVRSLSARLVSRFY